MNPYQLRTGCLKCIRHPLVSLSDKIFKIFKMIFNTVKSFHNKRFFYLGFRKVWVVQNSFPIVTKLNKINVKKNA